MQRRSFMKGASLSLLSTLVVSETSQAKVPSELNFKEEVSVVVCGGGMAGLTAAISAKEAGAQSVLLIEKGAFLGGHSILAGGSFYIGGTDIQKKAGIDDSPEKNFNDAVARGKAQNHFIARDTSVVKEVFFKGVDTLKWLQNHGVNFTDQLGQGAGNVKRMHFFAPGYHKGMPVAIKTLTEYAKKIGVQIQTNTRLLNLITASNEFGARVIGVEVASKSGNYLIKATKGVVLATGGFANGKELVKQLHPYLDGVASLGSTLNTGDGIVAARDIGANVIVEHGGFGMNMLFVGTHKGLSMGHPLKAVPLIVVAKNGTRFEDETKGYLACTHKMIEKGYLKGNWIFDQKAYEDNKDGMLKTLFEGDVVNKYSTIEDLAKGEGINPEALLKTIKQYNSDVEKGKDSQYGRTLLLQKIEKEPFYAFEVQPKIFTSYSGIEINTKGQVIDSRGKVIPGLYAAGDVTGQPYQQARLASGGVAGLSTAATYGRIAGENVAKD